MKTNWLVLQMFGLTAASMSFSLGPIAHGAELLFKVSGSCVV